MRKQLLGAAFLALAASFARAEPMQFDFACTGNAVESCFIYAEGEIGPETDKAFERFLASEMIEGNQIVLHSEGGNLGAGVRLGRLIRENRLTSIVGEAERVAPGETLSGYAGFPTGGTCASACAYAFLGGDTRKLSEGSRLGFHQFYMGARGESSSAQQVSGVLVSYLVDMGIDARIFARASSEGAKSMYWVDPEEAVTFDLITPTGYGDFFLEPYGNGVIAAARRLSPPGPYDLVTQVTAYCRDSVPNLMFTADFAPEQSAGFEMVLDGASREVSASRVSTRRSDSAGYIEVTLSPQEAQALASAQSVDTSFGFGRAAGGFYPARLEMSDMDRRMLEAAFRLCL